MLGAVFLIVHDVRDFFVFVTTFFGVSSYLLLGLVQERGTVSITSSTLRRRDRAFYDLCYYRCGFFLMVPIAPVERGSFYA